MWFLILFLKYNHSISYIGFLQELVSVALELWEFVTTKQAVETFLFHVYSAIFESPTLSQIFHYSTEQRQESRYTFWPV